MTESRTFSQLVKEVGEWSERNFGDQDGLNEVAPFLGVVEELLFELQNFPEGWPNLRSYHLIEFEDVIADSLIFLADFFYRYKYETSGLYLGTKYEGDMCQEYLYKSVGIAARSVLKRRQGIRDINDADVVKSLKDLFHCICSYYQSSKPTSSPDIQDLVWSTWEKVKKRDWKKNPENAHEVADAQ